MAETAQPQSSQFSLASIKQTASELPRRKAFSWVAQWFTMSQLVAKILALTLSSISVSLILSWESRGVRVEDLDTSFDTGSFSGRVIFFTIVGLLTTVYAVVMVVIGLSGVKMPAIVQAGVSGVVLTLWFLSAPIMSATVVELADSRYARWRNLDITQLQIATGLGFVCMVVSVADVLLAFLQLSQTDTDSAQFSVEVKTSRSVISARRSAESMTLSVTGTVHKRSSRPTPSSSLYHPQEAREAPHQPLLLEEATQEATQDDTQEAALATLGKLTSSGSTRSGGRGESRGLVQSSVDEVVRSKSTM